MIVNGYGYFLGEKRRTPFVPISTGVLIKEAADFQNSDTEHGV